MDYNNTSLPECRSCRAKQEDFYAGVLTDYSDNGKQVFLKEPIAYMRQIEKQLQSKQQAKGHRPYNVSIRVSPKDHRQFLSAEFTYGKRRLVYTALEPLPRVRTKEVKTVCHKQVSVTKTTRKLLAIDSMKSFVAANEPAWLKKGYRGQHALYDYKGVTLLKAAYNRRDDAGEYYIDIHSRLTDTNFILLTAVYTSITESNISARANPKDWANYAHRQLQNLGFVGYIDTNINSYGKLIIAGKYTKTEYESKTGSSNSQTTYTEIVYYNSNRIPDLPKPEALKTDNRLAFRTFMQDTDTYQPERRSRQDIEHIRTNIEADKQNVENSLFDRAKQYRLQAKAIKKQIEQKENYAEKQELWQYAEQLEKQARAIE